MKGIASTGGYSPTREGHREMADIVAVRASQREQDICDNGTWLSFRAQRGSAKHLQHWCHLSHCKGEREEGRRGREGREEEREDPALLLPQLVCFCFGLVWFCFVWAAIYSMCSVHSFLCWEVSGTCTPCARDLLLCLIHAAILKVVCYYPMLTDEETEAQWGQMIACGHRAISRFRIQTKPVWVPGLWVLWTESRRTWKTALRVGHPPALDRVTAQTVQTAPRILSRQAGPWREHETGIFLLDRDYEAPSWCCYCCYDPSPAPLGWWGRGNTALSLRNSAAQYTL